MEEFFHLNRSCFSAFAWWVRIMFDLHWLNIYMFVQPISAKQKPNKHIMFG